MNKLQILLITLLCFGLSACGLIGLNESNKYRYNETSKDTISAKEQILNALEKSWSPKIKNVNGINISLYLNLDKNGNVKDISIKEIICPSNMDEICKLASENCLNAIKQGSPYNLLDEHGIQKDFIIFLNFSVIPEVEISKLSGNVYVEVPKN